MLAQRIRTGFHRIGVVIAVLIAVPSVGARAKQRLLNYRPGSGSKFECPSCWVYNEVRSPLTAIPGTDEYDVLRCHGCGSDWNIPLG
jgi:hypothetical protein